MSAVITLILFCGCFLFGSFLSFAQNSRTEEPVQFKCYKSIVIQEGDSLVNRMSGKYTITGLSLTKRYPHFDGLRRSRKLCKMRCPDCKGTRHSKYNGSNMVLRRAASCRLSVRLPCICKRTAYSRNSQLTAQNSSVFSRFNLYDKY